MSLRRWFLAFGMIVFIHVQNVDSDCPRIYQMISENHSFCAKKISLSSQPPTSKEIEMILEMHNQERTDANANDMQKMYWNGDLAEIAQRYAEHCDYDHDTSLQRQAPRLPMFSGQNLGMGYQSWNLVIQAWADEKKDFVYGSSSQKGVVGHYTQMVKSTAVLVGCGLAVCPRSSVDPNRDWPHYVCNYVTGQISDYKPYTPADSSNPSDKRLHDCQGLVCLYNGVLDLNSCQCKCESYASGQACENLDCSSLTDQCDYGTDKSLCAKFANVPSECPKFCGLCDQFDEMKKHYDGSIRSFAHFSKSPVFIQLIIVLCFVYVS